MHFKWTRHYHLNGKLASIEASVVKVGFPGLTDTHTAIILPSDGGKAMAYVRMNDGQLGQSTIWAGKVFGSIRAAQGWASRLLERI